MNIFFNHCSPTRTKHCSKPSDKFITLTSPFSPASHPRTPSYPIIRTNSHLAVPYKSRTRRYSPLNLLGLSRKAGQNC